MIELKNVSKKYDSDYVLENVNAVINKGDVIAVIGPSGTGKSTLLNCINVLHKPTSGKVIFDGVDLTDNNCNINLQRRKIGMVFQQFNLFGHLTVIENVMKPQIDLLGRSKQEAYVTAMEYLRLVGMADKKFKYPSSLSGGQKQRVAIARTVAMNPEVILFDEPTSALDPTMVGEVEYVIKKLANMGATMMIVTHEMRFAREISNRVFYMDEKGIYEDDTTRNIFENPKKEKTRRFIKQIKCLEITTEGKNTDYVSSIHKIEEFGNKLAFSQKTTKKLQLLFEETVIRSILPNINDKEDVKFIVEYFEETNEKFVYIKHNGKKILDSDNIDELSKKIIESCKKEFIVTEE